MDAFFFFTFQLNLFLQGRPMHSQISPPLFNCNTKIKACGTHFYYGCIPQRFSLSEEHFLERNYEGVPQRHINLEETADGRQQMVGGGGGQVLQLLHHHTAHNTVVLL